MRKNPQRSWGVRTRRKVVDRLPVTVGVVLGCGYFGCVYATGKKDRVVKITSDASEASLAKWMLANRFEPRGIVQYYDGWRLAGESYYRRPLHALLREAATPVEPSDFYQRVHSLFDEYVVNRTRHALRGVADTSRDLRRLSPTALRRAYETFNEGALTPAKAAIMTYRNNIAALAESALYNLAIDMDELFMAHGIMFTDLHVGNFGVNEEDELVLLDPGFVLFADPSEIENLEYERV